MKEYSRKELSDVHQTISIIEKIAVEAEKEKVLLNKELSFCFFLNQRKLKPVLDDIQETVKFIFEDYKKEKGLPEQYEFSDQEFKEFDAILLKDQRYIETLEKVVEFEFERIPVADIKGCILPSGLILQLEKYLFED